MTHLQHKPNSLHDNSSTSFDSPPKTPNESALLLSAASTHSFRQASESYGYFLMFLSSLAFSGMSFFTRIAEHSYNFPTILLVYLRSIIYFTLSFLYILRFLNLRWTLSSFTSRQYILIFVRGVLGAFSAVTLYDAYRVLPVGDAVALFFSSPIITMLLGAIFLSEHVSSLEAVCSVVSMLGVVMISRPGFATQSISAHDRLWGSANMLVGAFLFSASAVVIRGLGTSVHFMVSIFSMSAVSIPVAVILGGTHGLKEEVVRNKEGAFFVLLSTLSAFMGHCWLTCALQHCRAGPGLLISNLEVPLAFVLGLVLLGEELNWVSIVGSCLIVGATVIIGWKQMTKR